jgi:hypothetical protein
MVSLFCHGILLCNRRIWSWYKSRDSKLAVGGNNYEKSTERLAAPWRFLLIRVQVTSVAIVSIT